MDAEKLDIPRQEAEAGLHRRGQVFVLLVVAVAVAAGFVFLPGLYRSFFSKSEPAEAPKVAEGAFKPTPLQWASLKTQTVREMSFRPAVQADGKIAINDDRATPIYAPYSGRVTAVFGREGDRVDHGAPLFRIDSPDLVQAQNDFVTALSGSAKAKSQVDLLRTVEQRNHALYDAHGGALKDWQQSQADLAAAQNDERSAQIALAATRSKLRIFGQSDDIIAQIAATGRANADLVVDAPMDATILERKLGLGQYVSQGAGDPLFRIGNLSTVWLVANVRESDTSFVKLGQPVEVRVAAYLDRAFDARITFVAASVDPNTHRLPIRAEVSNQGGQLKPEMWASFRILVGDTRKALAVPTQAIVYEADRARVWLAQADKSIVSRAIKTGIVDSDNVEVLSGLSAGDVVITQGSIFIDRAATGG